MEADSENYVRKIGGKLNVLLGKRRKRLIAGDGGKR